MNPTPSSDTRWVPVWASSPHGRIDVLESPEMAIPAALSAETVRQAARVSLGGDRVRIVVSNAFGPEALEVGRATLGRGTSAAAVVTELRTLTFGGREEIRIAPGASAMSDPVDLPLEPLERIAVSLFFPRETPVSTLHWTERSVGVIGLGDQTAATQLTVERATTARLFLSQVLVSTRSAGTVVMIGDSLTDSAGDDEGHEIRWGDLLAERLVPFGVSVVNAAISGNRLLSDGMGGAASSRLGRELLALPGRKAAIVCIGFNDIFFPGSPLAPDEPPLGAETLIAGYQQLVAQAHVNGIRVVGATLPPCEGAMFVTAEKNETRMTVNRWIRTGGLFDAVIDVERALCDPEHPSRLRLDADSGDHLHPNAVGHRLLAEAIDVRALVSL